MYNPKRTTMVARALMVVALAGLLSSTFYLLLVGWAVLRFRRKRLADGGAELPPATLLKPVHGIEPQLRDSLESFFRLDYPRFEIIFGARTGDDPALAIVHELMRIYPQVPVKLVTSGEPPWPNAKCWSLAKMVEPRTQDQGADASFRGHELHLPSLASDFRGVVSASSADR